MKRDQWSASCSVARYVQSNRLVTTCQGIVDRTFVNPPAQKRMQASIFWTALMELASWQNRLTICQGSQDGQEAEFFARLLALVCSSGGRCFRKLVPIHTLRSDFAGGVHVGNDDLDIVAGDQGILVGYAVDEETLRKDQSQIPLVPLIGGFTGFTGFNGSTSCCPGSRLEIRRRESGVSITLQQQRC